VEGPSRPCGHPTETGEHIGFRCPLHNNERNPFLRGKKTWTDINDPPYDAIGAFFNYLYFES